MDEISNAESVGAARELPLQNYIAGKSNLLTRLADAPGLVPDAQAETRRVRLSFSSELPVLRQDSAGKYFEVLGHNPGEVDLTRLQNGAPLMLNHQLGVGIVERAWIEGGRGHAEVRLSRRDGVADLWTDIADGIVKNVSVGYRTMAEPKTSAEKDKTPTYRYRWEPLEISILTLPPADASIGIGRSWQGDFLARYSPEIQQEQPMSDNTAPGVVSETATPVVNLDEVRAAAAAEALQRENARQTGIREAFRAFPQYRDLMDTLMAEPATTADTARARLLAELGKGQAVIAAQPISGTYIAAGEDEAEKARQAATESLLFRANYRENGRRLDMQGNPYHGMTLRELARACLERNGVKTTGLSAMDIVGRAFTQSTSDFPVILENTLHKTLLQAYVEIEPTWSRWCDVTTVTDFRSWKRIAQGGIANLPTISELGEYTNLTIPDGVSESVQATTKGAIINISRQAVVNDDLGYFTGVARAFGQAASRTVEKAAYDKLVANPTMNEDSTALFHANHSNLAGSGGALSVTTLDTARAAMARQKDPASAGYLDIRPDILLVPTEYVGTGNVLINAQYDPDTANKLQKPNMVNGLVSQVIGSPYLATTAWYLLANPNLYPTIEVAFLNGQQSPYLEMENGFDVDGVRWKVRLDFGVAAVGWRGAYKNPGA